MVAMVTTAPPRLRLENTSKTYGATKALTSVDLEIAPGEIHCLLGQNGSGKSTLAKVLSGYHHPDRGATLHIDGEAVALPARPSDLRRLGVSIVHQSLGLVDAHSVLENVRIGRFGAGRLSRRIDWNAEYGVVRQLLQEVGSDVDPSDMVASLAPSERARVAIARAIQDHAPGHGLIVFDESTRSLPRAALRSFYALVRSLVSDGASVLLVSHSLDEVLSIGDRVTVLRDGRVIQAGISTAGLSEHDLVHMMLGRALEAFPARVARPGRERGVNVSNLSGAKVQNLSFEIGVGEIVGLTGSTSSGFEDVPSLISGYLPATGGTLAVREQQVSLAEASVADLLNLRVFLVPERRDVHGLAYGLSVLENVTLPRVRQHGSSVHLGRAWQVAEAREVVRRLGIVPPVIEQLVGHLSGGNQQKVLMGKWLQGKPRFLVLHEPTQGVDVGARVDLLRLISDTAQEGCSILIASAEQEDLSILCDRVIVMQDGVSRRVLPGPASIDDIVEAVYGADAAGVMATGTVK